MKAEIIKGIKDNEHVEDKILRICAYCRVSTSMKDQLHSYTTQLEYYKRIALDHLNWQLIDIYADEGITGRSTINREQFNQMIDDAKEGMYDMIICKSISRFSRDVVTALDICRQLKEKGIDVYFEKENIHTLFLNDETQFTYYATFAQSESETISKNIRWATQKRMKHGTWVPCVMPYGYKVLKEEIVKEDSEVKVVDFIFNSFINGSTMKEIADDLNEQGIVTRKGSPWRYGSIYSIITNPIYHGELVAQKTLTEQTAPYYMRLNNRGQLPKYHYMDNHEPYIDMHQKEQVEKMMEFRRSQKAVCKADSKYNKRYALSQNIYCHECGSVLKRIKANQSRDITYFAYGCKRHRQNKDACSFISFKEKAIERAFVRMTNKLIYHESILISYLDDIRNISREANNARVHELKEMLDKQYDQANFARQHYLSGTYDKAFYEEMMQMIFDHTMDLRKQYRELKNTNDLTAEIQNTTYVQAILHNHKVCDTFDEILYERIVQETYAMDKQTIKFILVNGLEIEEGMQMI